jgi:hypothetical protein
MNSNQIVLNSMSTIILFIYPLISLVGVSTNILSIVIFSRKRFKKTVFATYFRFLTIIDTFVVLLPINKFFELYFNFYIENQSEFLCKLRFFLPYSIKPNSQWIIVAISLDRFISISRPGKFLFRKKTNFQLFSCSFIFLFNLIYYSIGLTPYLIVNITYDNISNTTIDSNKCIFNSPTLMLWMDFINSAILPFVSMTILTILTLKTIMASRRRSASTIVIFKKNAKQNSKLRDVKFTRISVSLNVMFLLFNVPFSLYALIDQYTFDSIDPYLDLFLYVLTLFFHYCNFTSVFFINILSNSIFKDEFFKIFDFILMNKY